MKTRTAAVLLIGVLLLGLAPMKQTWGSRKIPRIGILTFFAPADDPTLKQWYEPFRLTLSDHGWTEGKNVLVEYRSARGDPSRLAEAAAELVRLQVDVIWATGAPFTRAAYAATQTIPIVGVDFTSDPLAEGYVESYGKPGRNLTGIFLDAPEFAGKWFELLRALVPGLSRVAVLWDPSPGPAHLQAAQKIARTFHIQLQVLEVREPDDFDRAFSMVGSQTQAMLILPSPMMFRQSARLAELTMKHRLPATSMARLFAESGGVASYGPDYRDAAERAAILIAKILAGAKPGDLPVERPTKVQLVVNLKTAKALGLTVPESILYRADEVIR